MFGIDRVPFPCFFLSCMMAWIVESNACSLFYEFRAGFVQQMCYMESEKGIEVLLLAHYANLILAV